MSSSAQLTPASSVPLLLPTTVAYDSAGNLYVAETNRHVIDRIDVSGNLTVVAGNGTQGFFGDGGAATAAQLDSPQGLAVDSAGNVYVADTHNHRVRMVAAATGLISTIAGTGLAGFSGDQGSAVAAQLSLPTALALDIAGNLDIADSNNHRIRQLNLGTGVLRTVAGTGIQGNGGDNGPALKAPIDTPTGLAVDAAGNLYLADSHNQRVRRVSAAGMISTVAGGGALLPGGTTLATATRLLLPRGLSFDSAGNLYLADTQAHRILRVAADGTLSIAAGQGTQGFAGDSGPATDALLDSPRSASVSPSGLITLADTGNQRVRQFNAGGTIGTVIGVGNPTPSALTLAAPGTVGYGTGSLAVTIASSTPATGAISFFDTSNGLLSTLGTGPLNGNAASFSTAHLSAGAHRLQATYSGDATHPALQSSIVPLSVRPAPLAVSPNPASALYGQAIPALTGSVSGVLPQDASALAAAFSTAASALSPAGAYPIGATLTGASAANYQIAQLASASLVIAQAPTATALTASASSLTQAVTLSARTLSTTQGVPTGRITFFDSGASMGVATLDAAGACVFLTTLAAGPHTVTAVYSGDTNFLSSSSAAVSAVVLSSSGVSPDFTLAVAEGAAQTVAPGASARYPFGVSIVNGPLNSPILLTATGMPLGATATFDPSYLPPGGAAATFTLTVQTARTTAGLRPTTHPPWATVLWGVLVAAPLGLRRRKRGCRAGSVAILLSVVFAGLISGCGDRIAALPQSTSTSVVYPMMVTATSTSSTGAVLQHTASVTLTLQ